jgi:RNA polymerase sigma-70 factor (ECF subfamily)
MYGVCLRYARSPEEAQDVLHDGFLKVFSCLNKYKGIGSFEGWIRRIMVHTAINCYRSYDSHCFANDNSDEIVESEAINVVDSISHKELIARINELPDGYRIIFNMYVIEGYKHHEIADLLGISESTSKTQLMKARKVLMKKLGKNIYEKTY